MQDLHDKGFMFFYDYCTFQMPGGIVNIKPLAYLSYLFGTHLLYLGSLWLKCH